MDDRKIVLMLWNRMEEAVEAMTEKFGRRLLATARNILGNHQDAEEAVSDTYLAVWEAIPPKEPDPLAGFVYQTGRNQALKRLRYESAQKRNSGYNVSLEELAGCIAGASLEDEFDARLLGRAIDRFLDTTSKTSRILFLRRYWFGDSVKEIARHFDMTENAVTVRLSRTRQQLRTYLIKEGFCNDSENSRRAL